ncbi:MAG TPA: type II toxin-antitoxin system VapC family toxin [Thermoanaerobaculia bacterium]
MSHYCLDTSAYSHFKKGDPAVVDLIDRAEWLGVPSIVVGELWIGFLLGGRLERNQAELNEFLTHPPVVELVADHEVARIYAEMVVSLRKAGTPIPSNDVWIAATAKRMGVPVLTYDGHFLDIQQAATLLLPTPSKH